MLKAEFPISSFFILCRILLLFLIKGLRVSVLNFEAWLTFTILFPLTSFQILSSPPVLTALAFSDLGRNFLGLSPLVVSSPTPHLPELLILSSLLSIWSKHVIHGLTADGARMRGNRKPIFCCKASKKTTLELWLQVLHSMESPQIPVFSFKKSCELLNRKAPNSLLCMALSKQQHAYINIVQL